MRCAHCQSDRVADARGRCPACGEPHAGGPACGGCGFANPPGFRFCGQCGNALESSGQAHPSGSEPRSSELTGGAAFASGPNAVIRRERLASADAERRQLTILFCDLVGSTRLSHRMDPEDYHALLMAYRATCVRSIERYGGSEIRHIGDGTQAYFGYPRALEDAAERAVLTALDIVDAVARLARSSRWAQSGLAVRIGIGSGLVITDRRSHPDGAGLRMTEALGETPNLAARIQSVAPINGVVVSPLTRQLLGDLFTLIDCGEQDFKGIDHPVRVWQVVGVAAADRFAATHTPGTDLVNREQELPALLEDWEKARRGRGRVVVLSGEGGIGKSRIARVLHERIARREAHSSLFLQCSPIYSNTALHPIVSSVESLAGLRLADSATDKLDKLDCLLKRSSVPSDLLLPLLVALLDIDDDTRRPSSVDWRELRERLTDALIGHLCEVSVRRPLLIVFEALQWIDPSTSELLERAVRAIGDYRVMIVVTCRPDVFMPWFRLSHVTVIPLERFTPGDVAELAGQIAGGRTLPAEVLSEIIEKTDGVPLFVEEIVKTLMTSGLLEVDGDACVLDGPLPPLAIPPTLTDSLMARLDQLGADRRFAQLGAVIGRDFTLQLLASVAAEPEETVAAALGSLVAAGVLGRRTDGTQALYSFNHALMRDAALESMLRSQRKRTHATVAHVLETRFPSVGQANPELLARHYTEAALLPEAIDRWLLAGRRASTRSETLEAIAHLRHGLALIPVDDPGEAMGTRHLDLLIALGPALITHVGPGADEVRETYRGALTLCARLPESAAHFAAYWGWWRISRNFSDKRDTANELLRLAERLGDPGLALEAHHALWATSFVLGEQSTSLEHIRDGLALYAGGDYRDHASVYGGHDAQVCGEGEAALVLWLTGRAREALERIERALALAERLEHVGSRAHALDYALMLHFYRRDIDTVRGHAEVQLQLASDNHFGDYEMRALVFLGWALGLRGERDGGLQAIRKGMLAQRSSGTTEDFPIFFAMQAEVHLRYGQTAEAEALLMEASDYAAEQQVKLWDAEIYRLRAVAALAAARPAGEASAASHLRRALEVAHRQGASMLEYKVIETIRWAFGGAAGRGGAWSPDGTAPDESDVESRGDLSGAGPEERGDPLALARADHQLTDPSPLERAMLDVLRGERVVDPAAGGVDGIGDGSTGAAADERRRVATALLAGRAIDTALP